MTCVYIYKIQSQKMYKLFVDNLRDLKIPVLFRIKTFGHCICFISYDTYNYDFFNKNHLNS